MKTYTSYAGPSPNAITRIINNTLADNITWGLELVNDSIRYLVTKYYFNERTYSTLTIAKQQFYNLPPQVKKLINLTITIGSVVWQPKECPSRQFWDSLNVITFYQDFPTYFFIYNGQVGIFPIPSTAGNTINMNYKIRTIDLSQADVTDVSSNANITIPFVITSTVTPSSGSTSMVLSSTFPFASGSYQVTFSNNDLRTVTFTQGSTSAVWTTGLTGAATATQTLRTVDGSDYVSVSGLGTTVFYNWMTNNYIRVPFNATNNQRSGDNQWYRIASVASGTVAILANSYPGASVGTTGATIGTAAFTIGEVPILPEDYQDLPLYRMGEIYYTTRFPDPTKAQMYHSLWETGIAALDLEYGAKTTNVTLQDTDAPITNPNLFVRSTSQA